MTVPRREFMRAASGALLALAGCGSLTGPGSGSPRLSARPRTPKTQVTPGQLIPLTLPDPYGSGLYVPTTYQSTVPIPLLLALHGAGGSATGQLALMRPLAEQYGFALLAVSSRNSTWDAINGAFGPDIDYLDQALAFAFQRCNVDPTRLGVEGFSDGASYTLALAVVNGDLFRRAIAFSPGFIPSFDDAPNGDPEFFFSHGRQDTVLPIDCGTRRLASLLQADDYRVSVNEFDGVHEVPAEIADQAAQWLVGMRAVPPPVQHQFESPGATPCIPRPQ